MAPRPLSTRFWLAAALAAIALLAAWSEINDRRPPDPPRASVPAVAAEERDPGPPPEPP